MIYKYIIKCVDGSTMAFETTTDIDFHTISNTAIAFADIYINMTNIVYIQKQIISQ